MMHVSRRFRTMAEAVAAMAEVLTSLSPLWMESVGCGPLKDVEGKQTGMYAAWITCEHLRDIERASLIMRKHGALAEEWDDVNERGQK